MTVRILNTGHSVTAPDNKKSAWQGHRVHKARPQTKQMPHAKSRQNAFTLSFHHTPDEPPGVSRRGIRCSLHEDICLGQASLLENHFVPEVDLLRLDAEAAREVNLPGQEAQKRGHIVLVRINRVPLNPRAPQPQCRSSLPQSEDQAAVIERLAVLEDAPR